MSMNKLLRSACCLALAVLCLLPAESLAAGKFPDLTRSHWAYDDLQECVELGILSGMDDGTMAPNATLTWGQYLVMLARVHCPDAYRSALATGLAWDEAAYWACYDNALLLPDDFLPVAPDALKTPITRQDVAVLLDRLLPAEAIEDGPCWDNQPNYNWWWDEEPEPEPETAGEAFSDFGQYTQPYQDALTHLYSVRVVRGRDDGTFSGWATIMRCDGGVLLLRAVKELDDLHAGEDKTITLQVVNERGDLLYEPQEVETRVGAWTGGLANTDLLWHYTYDRGGHEVSSIQNTYTVTYRPFNKFEEGEAAFEEAVEAGLDSYDNYGYDPDTGAYRLQDYYLYAYGENERKYLQLFGSTEQRRFPDQATAAANMVTVEIPVWKLDRKGEKYSATAYLTMNAGITDMVKDIFTEIYNDPEQFPIQDIGGYGWRGDSATGEHNCGTAIDINATQNFQVRDGRTVVGTHWTPYEDPYSIPENGSVVRIFRKYGWGWGGEDWAGHTDPATDYHDYMHFSYMGM